MGDFHGLFEWTEWDEFDKYELYYDAELCVDVGFIKAGTIVPCVYWNPEKFTLEFCDIQGNIIQKAYCGLSVDVVV